MLEGGHSSVHHVCLAGVRACDVRACDVRACDVRACDVTCIRVYIQDGCGFISNIYRILIWICFQCRNLKVHI